MRLNTSDQTSPVTSAACPAFFRARCSEAAQGGSHGYREAAYELTRHLSELGPDDLPQEEWHAEIDRLEEMVRAADATLDRHALIGWYETRLPRCMDLVPHRRRRQFVEGLLTYADDHALNEF